MYTIWISFLSSTHLATCVDPAVPKKVKLFANGNIVRTIFHKQPWYDNTSSRKDVANVPTLASQETG